LLKAKAKDFLIQWQKSASEISDPDQNILNLLKFLNIARQKKMTMFTETHMQLTPKANAENLSKAP